LNRLHRARSERTQQPWSVLTYAQNEPTPAETAPLMALTEGHAFKVVRTPERLLEEVCLHIRRPVKTLSDGQRLSLTRARERSPTLLNRSVLAIDDDVRNIFALTAILERHGLKMYFAESAQAGIATLKRQSEIDIVLMDLMMPEMDGYQAMRAIRAMPQFSDLPIIALTAKAMKGDREKCLASGASDYIAKPVDVEKLLSMLKVWLDVPVTPMVLTDVSEPVRVEVR
jgi:CheY-like chemotaxis protein